MRVKVKAETVIKKVIICIVLFAIIGIINNTVGVYVVNSMATQQMSTDSYSNAGMMLYQNTKEYLSLWLFVVVLLIFYKEIKLGALWIIKQIKGADEHKEEK